MQTQTQPTNKPIKKSSDIELIYFTDVNLYHRPVYRMTTRPIRPEVARMTAEQADAWLKKIGFAA